MAEPAPWEQELKELRRELNDLRAEYRSLKNESIASYQTRSPSDRADFPLFFQGMIADKLRRRSAFLRIERRISTLEQRLTQLEAIARADSLSSAPH